MTNNKKIGEILLELDLITKDQLNAALLHQQQTQPNRKLGEILVELGFLNEVDLLRCLAAHFRVRYISSDRLSKLTIPQWIISLVPLDFAEKHNVLPFFCYDKTKILSVVIADPQDHHLPKLIKIVSGYHEVERYLALETTIKAGVAKYYRNDQAAFDTLKALTKGPRPSAIASFAPKHQQMVDSTFGESGEGLLKQEDARSRIASPPVSVPGESPGSMEAYNKRLADEVSSLSLMSDDTFIEVLNIVVNVLERYKGEKYKGHSAGVAKWVKDVSRNLGLRAKETYYNVLAAYLHDCCMNAPEHLTLLHFNNEDGNNLLVKYSKSLGRIFENAKLPEEVMTLLIHTFERYDGEGYPHGLKGKEIPLGSQIIAAVDAFSHLLYFEHFTKSVNPYRLAFQAMKADEGKLFDPDIMSRLEVVIVEYFIDETSPRVIIVDNDSEELAKLSARLRKEGIMPYPLSSTDDVLKVLDYSPVSLILSEVTTQPVDGFSLCRTIKSDPAYKDIRFIFLSELHDSSTIGRGFDSGADDFIAKPYHPDVMIAKIQNLLKPVTSKIEKTTDLISQKRGFTGNLAEIQVIDLIQMLSSGSKSGALRLMKDEESGDIFFTGGSIISSRYKDLEGVEAFNLLIRWKEGVFMLDPEAKLPEQNIYDSTERLLIEAYRVWDEEGGDKKDDA